MLLRSRNFYALLGIQIMEHFRQNLSHDFLALIGNLVCVCVCVCETHTETDRQTHTQTHRHTHTHTLETLCLARSRATHGHRRSPPAIGLASHVGGSAFVSRDTRSSARELTPVGTAASVTSVQRRLGNAFCATGQTISSSVHGVVFVHFSFFLYISNVQSIFFLH